MPSYLSPGNNAFLLYGLSVVILCSKYKERDKAVIYPSFLAR